MQIRIKQDRGQGERLVPYSPTLKRLMGPYLAEHDSPWLFPGDSHRRPLTHLGGAQHLRPRCAAGQAHQVGHDLRCSGIRRQRTCWNWELIRDASKDARPRSARHHDALHAADSRPASNRPSSRLDLLPPPELPTMTPLRQRMLEDLCRYNYAPRTQQTYVAQIAQVGSALRRLARSVDARASPGVSGPVDQPTRQLAAAGGGCHAILLQQDARARLEDHALATGGKPKSLPVVLTPEEVSRLLARRRAAQGENAADHHVWMRPAHLGSDAGFRFATSTVSGW